MNLRLPRRDIPRHLLHFFRPVGHKPKDLIDIPAMLAEALRADGWWLRSECIWAKKSSMPESVRDRPSCEHEYVFLLTKRARYFYDPDGYREPLAASTVERDRYTRITEGKDGPYAVRHDHETPSNPAGRNCRTVWDDIAPNSFPGAHFATMPVDLAARCIMLGTSEKGRCPECGAPWVRLVERTPDNTGYPNGPGGSKRSDPRGNGASPKSTLADVARYRSETLGWEPSCSCPAHDPTPCLIFDPFGGAGTTIYAARQLGRIGVATELNAEYLGLARARLRVGGIGRPKRVVSGQQSFLG